MTSAICTIVSILAIGTSIAGFTATPSTALADAGDDGIMALDNTGNTWYHFDLGNGYSTTAATESRAKENTTPLFIWPTEKTFDMCYVYGEGLNPTWGTWVDYTVNGHGAIYTTQAYSLKTNIYEYGCRSARITAWQCSQPGYMAGWWSPDSTREYTVCNAGY